MKHKLSYYQQCLASQNTTGPRRGRRKVKSVAWKCPVEVIDVQLLVTMTRSSLIFATIVSLTLAVPETRLRKCCPEGKVLSISPEMVCTIPEGDTDQFHIMDPEVADHQNEFPICKHQEDISEWKFYSTSLGTIKFFKAPCCIEIMQSRSTNEFTLVIVHSPHSENNSVEESNSAKTSEESNASLLQLLRITRCCPKGKVFDVLAKSCVTNVDSPENYSNIHEFFSLLPKLPFHIVKVSNGFHECYPGALFTYEIAAEDIEYEDESLWITISKDGCRRKIRTTINDGCVELTTNSRMSRRLVFRICRNEDYCQEHSCVRKCCQEHHNLSRNLRCTNGDSSSTPSAFYDALSNLTETAWSSTGYGVLFGSNCHRPYKLNSSEILGLTKEGYLRENFGLQHPHDSYCLDVFDNGTVMSLVCFPEHNSDTTPINRTRVPFNLIWHHTSVIRPLDRIHNEQLISQRYVITSSLEVISCVFLLLTLLVYIYLPYLQNLHGKTLICTAASLLVSYTCLAIIPWVTSPLSPCCMAEQCTSKSCAALGYIMLFSWLSAFSWLNVMFIDIWLTLGRVRENRCGGQPQGKGFLLYSMYAWGLALFITLFCVASDQLPFLPDPVKPKFGVKNCWFTPNTLAEVIFFHLPVAIQLTSNVVFFILTAKNCNQVKAEIRRMVADPSDTGSSRFHADRDRTLPMLKLLQLRERKSKNVYLGLRCSVKLHTFKLFPMIFLYYEVNEKKGTVYISPVQQSLRRSRLIINVKLFILMGITWIADIASSRLNTYSTYKWKETEFYWSDAINCLHGVLIFVVFVVKPRVYRAVKERLRLWRGDKGLCQGTSTIQDRSRVQKSASNSRD